MLYLSNATLTRKCFKTANVRTFDVSVISKLALNYILGYFILF